MAKDLFGKLTKGLLQGRQEEWILSAHRKLKYVKPLIAERTMNNRQNRCVEIVLARLRIRHTRLTYQLIITRKEESKRLLS